MKKYCSYILFMLAVPVTLTGQLFPYDRIGPEITITGADTLTILMVNDHTRIFHNDTVTLEVYFEPIEVIPPKGGWQFITRCIETIFVEKKQVKGSFKYPFKSMGKYCLLFYRDGCHLVHQIDFLPDGTYINSFKYFGKCPPPKLRKS